MNNNLLAANIKRLREELMLSRIQVAKASKISLMAYSNIENGLSIPKDETLEKIAYVLNVTINKLWQRENYSEQIRFRSDPKLQMRGRILDKSEDYVSFLKSLIDNSPRNDFMNYLNHFRISSKEPREVAISLRKEWNLGDEAIDGLLYLIRKKGVELFSYRATSEYFSSFSAIYKDFGPLIVFNSWEMIPVEDILFNVAHELGHIMLHSYCDKIFDIDDDSKQDKEADEFASYFLMPDSALKASWDLYQDLPLLEGIFAIKNKYKLGWENVAKRLSSFHNTDYLNKIKNILSRLNINLRINKEPNALSRDVLFKDGCKESFIPKVIISNICNNKIQKRIIENFFSKKDLNNSIEKFKNWGDSVFDMVCNNE